MSSLFGSKSERYEVARYVASVLRGLEAKELLEADSFGSIDIQSLTEFAVRRFPFFTAAHLFEIVSKDPQKRFEILGQTVRARTGHRFHVDLLVKAEEPPAVLYHGTSREAACLILRDGMQKMGKSYVHLADTIERARRVGERKQSPPVLLAVNAREAYRKGVRFWRSGQESPDGEIFLAEEIPPEFISRVDA